MAKTLKEKRAARRAYYYANRQAEISRLVVRQRRRRGLPEPTHKADVCELCGDPPRTRRLALDHDHTSGKFRGWLCANCNTGLGKLGDNVAGLERAIAYLRRAL